MNPIAKKDLLVVTGKMQSSEVWEVMRSIIEQPDYHFLQSNKADFYQIDKDILNDFAPEACFLWVVNRLGTHFTRIGVHAGANNWAHAALNQAMFECSSGYEIYLVSGDGVEKLTAGAAMEYLKRWQYSVEGEVIFNRNGDALAAYSLEIVNIPGDGNIYVNVAMQSSRLEKLGLADLTAIREIALAEAAELVRSLFVKVRDFTINGHQIDDLINKARVKQAADSACQRCPAISA